MSLTISLYGHSLPKLVRNVHPNLVSGVIAAIVSGTLAVPVGMVLTERLVKAGSPVRTAPAAPQRAGIVPIPTVPSDRGTGEAVANAALPMEARPDDIVTSAGTPTNDAETIAPPIETISMPARNLLSPGQADRIPDIAATAGGDTSSTVAHSNPLRTNGIHKTSHEAVLALLGAMSQRRAGTQPSRHAAKVSAVRNRPGSSTVKIAQLSAGTTMPMAAVNQFEGWNHNPGVLGGPESNSPNRAGLNGTGFRHRP